MKKNQQDFTEIKVQGFEQYLDEFAGSSCFDFLFSNVAGTEKKRCTTKRLQSPTLTPSSA